MTLARSTIILACGLFSFAASAKSSRMHNYTLDECTAKFCVHAHGEDAYVSFLTPVISAANTTLKVDSKTYQCITFAYFLSSSTLTCETRSKTSVIVDLSTSEVTELY